MHALKHVSQVPDGQCMRSMLLLLCPGLFQPRVSVMIGIFSRGDAALGRSALRQTMLHSLPQHLSARFVISSREGAEDIVDAEAARMHDIVTMRLPVAAPGSSALRADDVLALFSWLACAIRHYPYADFIGKSTDADWIRMTSVWSILQEATRTSRVSSLLLGHMDSALWDGDAPLPLDRTGLRQRLNWPTLKACARNRSEHKLLGPFSWPRQFFIASVNLVRQAVTSQMLLMQELAYSSDGSVACGSATSRSRCLALFTASSRLGVGARLGGVGGVSAPTQASADVWFGHALMISASPPADGELTLLHLGDRFLEDWGLRASRGMLVWHGLMEKDASRRVGFLDSWIRESGTNCSAAPFRCSADHRAATCAGRTVQVCHLYRPPRECYARVDLMPSFVSTVNQFNSLQSKYGALVSTLSAQASAKQSLVQDD